LNLHILSNIFCECGFDTAGDGMAIYEDRSKITIINMDKSLELKISGIAPCFDTKIVAQYQ
jgi:hypothetical protein